MKKITLCLCLIFSFYISSAQTYNYHRFETYPTAEKACVGNTSDAFVVKVNLEIDHLLNNGEYYVIDFGSNFNLGVRYAKVLNRYSGTGDADFYLDGSGIGSSTDVCSLIYRYHRFETFTTLQKAENRVCGTSTNHDGIWKVNILIDRLLDHDEVYQINLGGSLGTRYCRVLNRYNGNGDADFSLNGQSIGNPININCVVDSDNDGIPDGQDNCPNNANANQADMDNDGIGNVCDNQDNRDSDGDGVQNYEDNCPNESGPASNDGCPGSPDLLIDVNNTFVNNPDCSSCNSRLADIGGNRYLLKPQGYGTSLDIRIINNGNVTSSQSNIKYYLSSNSTLGTTDDSFGPISNFGTISPGNYSDVSNISIDYYTISGILGGATGNYFILMALDEDDSNDESNESNNITPIPIRVSNSSSAKLLIGKNNFSQQNLDKERYSVSVYNFSGQQIFSKEVHGLQEENEIIKTLDKNGIYIIKSKDSTRKVYVGHN